MGTLLIITASILWGGLHSWMASLRFKNDFERTFGGAAFNRWYRFVYNAVSLLSFLPLGLIVFFAPDQTLYTIPAPWMYLASILQAAALIGLVAGILHTDPLSFTGLRQVITGGEGKAELVTSGLYRFVRHPLYTGGLVLMWLTSTMTINLLTLYVCLTAYLFIGALFEERKLLREFGQAYADYQACTPMMIPFLRFK
jgi:protein-S-isoprenylcysteine O-methyltransferase Ste14